MRSASEFRQMARETLSGNWKLAMGTGLAASLIGDCRYGAKWNNRAAKSDTGTTGSEECADAGISDAQHASALGAFAYLGLDGGYYWRCGADGICPFPSESGREKGSVLF